MVFFSQQSSINSTKKGRMEINNDFSKLVTKFLFLNCGTDRNEDYQNEINVVINDLNSLNYNSMKIMEVNGIYNLFDSIVSTPANEDTLIVKSCCLITTIISKQKIQLPLIFFKRTIDWLTKCLKQNFRPTACDALSCLKTLFKHHSHYCLQFWEKFLLPPNSLLLDILDNKIENKSNADYDACSNAEILVSAILCIQYLLTYSEDHITASSTSPKIILTSIHENILETIGMKILDFIYNEEKNNFNNSKQEVVFITSALNILHTITKENQEWAENNLGRILGAARAFIHYDLPDVIQLKPQCVSVSHQPLFEVSTTISPNKGGKIQKTRRLKTISKSKRVDKNQNSTKKDTVVITDTENVNTKSNFDVDFDLNFLSSLSRTSDSDFFSSEVDGTNRNQNEMHKAAKLRLSAISVIGLITKITEKKILYGYWHAIFPFESHSQINNSGIMTSVLRDPNPRNRIAALQTSSVLLYGSKLFLFQAENTDKPPTTFTPFSLLLGNTILSIYESLTNALSTESSLPVLTQILKCLSVLIQNTPFHRLRSGFVTNFTKYVRQLIFHRDITIKVAALIVMEFLISVQEPTPEILECIGSSKITVHSKRQNKNQLNDNGVEEVIGFEEEEFLNSDEDEEEEIEVKTTNFDKIEKMPWLLKIILDNLLLTSGDTKIISSITTPVRIGSLQVLSAMALHFPLIKDHLNMIANTLKITLNDNQPEIRLSVSKCLDIIGDSINKYLLENIDKVDNEIIIYQNFWTNILPVTIEKIQDQNQSAMLKGYLCDFLSNIGIHIFERLSQNTRIQIISLLTGIGCNEDSIVRASAVRTLAIYIIFPSLREDLCYIENTTELAIQLMNDSNLYARIKASWAMGNISDMFLMSNNNNNTKFNKISNDLFKEMLEITINSTTDNDKVRSNAVRTLGNLLRIITEEHLINSEIWRKLCIKGIERLENCMNSSRFVKVKWNSCYAIGNFMRNDALFKSYNFEFNWQKLIFPSLCNVIVNNSNFKVRINGAAALAVINNRKYYDQYINQIWSSILLAIEQSDHLTDFNEYKHRDNLQEQLCLTLSHIIKIANLNDFVNFKTELISKLEVVKQIWLQVINRILPESSASLFSCIIHLKGLLNDKNILTTDQKNAIQLILSCLESKSQEFSI